ncbi:MAG: carboxypeptidase regulatory-like domain-containing protein, partial [Planctomycetes bacterium]|nr:carboxypeptidase regulatory-like domain-containing protein [Planctomycetota bacterium]
MRGLAVVGWGVVVASTLLVWNRCSSPGGEATTRRSTTGVVDAPDSPRLTPSIAADVSTVAAPEDRAREAQATYEVHGRVVDERSRPVSDASVHWEYWGEDGSGAVVSATRDGAFRIAGVELSAIRLRATARGYLDSSTRTIDVESASSEPVLLVLRSGWEYRPRVVGTRGQVVEGAIVSLRPRTSSAFVAASTDASGRCELRAPVADDYTLAVTHPDYLEPCGSFALDALPEDIRLERPATIQVVVDDPLGIPFLDSTLVSLSGDELSTHDRIAKSGVIVWDRVVPGRYRGVLSGGPYPPLVVDLQVGEAEVHEIRYPASNVGRATTIQVVTHTGIGIPDAEVRRRELGVERWGPRVVTDRDGSVVLFGIEEGEVDLKVSADGCATRVVRDIGRWVRDASLRIELSPLTRIIVDV